MAMAEVAVSESLFFEWRAESDGRELSLLSENKQNVGRNHVELRDMRHGTSLAGRV